MYLSVWMSSVNGVRKATFFIAGKIGLLCDQARLRLLLGEAGANGLLVRMEMMLKATL